MIRRIGSPAKITRPRAEGILHRKRLFRFLDKARNLPITWVSGPPGSGKTTLAASYLDARKLPCLWYRIDEGDADGATFFYYMALGAKKAAPSKRRPLPPLTPEYLMGIPVFTRRYFEDLYSRLRPPFIIIFDNYQDVSIDSGFHEIIYNALEVIPEGINVFVLSRNVPPLQLARLRANHRISFLGWNEIRFTVEETRGILGTKGNKRLSDKALIDLQKKTEGWAAGLVLITLSSATGTIHDLSIKRFPTKDVFEYFAIEIFEKLEGETKHFFLKTAFLPKMTVQIAEKLTGNPTSGRMLSELSENHYFTERYSEDSPVYRYHPLFREFLLSRARESFTGEEIASIQRHAAQLLEESAQVEDAAELFRDGKDWDRLMRLILTHSPSLISQGRNKTLQEWIESIPGEVRKNIPWLLYWLGVSKQPLSLSESRLLFERAFHLFQDREDEAGIFLAWSGVVDTILFGWDDFTHLDRWIEWLEERTRHNPSFPSSEIEARVASTMTGALLWRQPGHPDIRKWVERALSLSQKSQNINVRIQTFSYASLYYSNMFIGELDHYNMVAEETRRVAQAHAVLPLTIIAWKINEIQAYLSVSGAYGAYDLALQSVREGLEIAKKSGVHILDFNLLACGVYGSLSKYDLPMTAEFLKKMEANLRDGQRNNHAHYHCLTGWYHLLLGNISLARFHADKALTLCKETGTRVPETTCHHLLAFILHEAGESQRAETHLSTVNETGHQLGIRWFEFSHLMTGAHFAIDRGNEASALESLRKAMTMGREQRFDFNQFLWRPSVMTRLCTKALENGIEIDYVQNLIRKHNLFPDTPPLEIETWPWPLRIYTLGRFEILKDGKPVQFSGKVQKKPLQMLKALIALGGSEVKEEELTDLFWPDVDGDAGHSNFTTTLSRLRRLLGHETAIKFQEGKATLDPHYCWVDAWAFERILGQTESILRGIDDTENQEDKKGEILTLADKTIDIYKGHFLSADEKYSWTTSYRERLRSKFIRLITRFGDYLQQTGQWEKAVEHYQKGLDVDEFAEEYYQHLMICYHRVGQPVKAIEVYRRCKKTLSAVLEIEPSPKTQSIYQSIIKNMKIRSSIPK